MGVYISEMLNQIDKAKSRNDKAAILKKYKANRFFMSVLWNNFNRYPPFFVESEKDLPDIKCDDGPLGCTPGSLYNAARTFYTLRTNHPCSHEKKMKIYISTYQGLHKDEAKIYKDVILGRLKVNGLTEKLIREVFPNLLPPILESPKKKTKPKEEEPQEKKVDGSEEKS